MRRFKFYYQYFVLIFFLFSCGIFLAGPVSAATKYVSLSGTDDASHGSAEGTDAYRTVKYALTGSRLNKGDTLIITNGTYDETQTAASLGAGSGTTIVKAKEGDTVNLNIASSGITNCLFFLQSAFEFKHINFINSNNIAKSWFYLYSENNYIFEDCTFDWGVLTGNVSTGGIRMYGAFIENVIFRRCTISNNYIFISADSTSAKNITFESSQAWDNNALLYNNSGAVNLKLYNNTFINPENIGSYFFYLRITGSTLTANNNIFTTGGENHGKSSFSIAETVANEWLLYPERLDLKYNIFWNYYEPDNASYFNLCVWNSASTFLPIDITNKSLNPEFTDYANHDLTLTANSYAAGNGSNEDLPVTGDYRQLTWPGQDVGCFANPTHRTLPEIIPNKVVFFGDSLLVATNGGTTPPYEGWRQFSYLTADYNLIVPDTLTTALGGLYISGGVQYINQILIEQAPETVFVANGLGDMNTPKTNQSNTQIAAEIITVMQKIEDFGARPIWLGIGSNNGNPPNNTDIKEVNNLVDVECDNRGWKHGSILTQMEQNSNWQTDYYLDLATNLHPNSAGQYVIAEVAEYLYFPHHTVSQDRINISSGARIYRNGQFRDLANFSDHTADLLITPENGEFISNNYSQWLDLTNIIWEGTSHKAWSEQTNLESVSQVVHTVGDLAANKYYSLTIDGQPATAAISTQCAAGKCLADAQGKIAFINPGPYVTAVFSLTQDLTSPAVSASIAAGNYHTSQSVSLSCTDEISGCDKIYYTLDNSEPTLNSLQYSTAIQINNSITLKFLATDLSGNISSVQNVVYTIKASCSNSVWPPGNDIDKFVKIHSLRYSVIIKKNFGTTIHLYDANCNLIDKERLSTRLFSRQMIKGNFLGNKKTEEIALATLHGSTVYVKVLRYSLSRQRWLVLKEKAFKHVPKTFHLKKSRKNNILIKNKSIVLYNWKI